MQGKSRATRDDIPKVYLDNCCYGRPFDDSDQFRVRMETSCKMEIQRMVRRGELALYASTILMWENNSRRDVQARDEIYDFIHGYAVDIVHVTDGPDIIPTMLRVMSGGIKTMDAYHIASAMHSKCDYLITTDDKMLKYRADGMEIVSPVQFMMGVEANGVQ